MERQSTRKLFKLVIALVALFTLALSVFAFGACGGEEHKHEYTGSNKTEANCGKIGVETFTCSCGDTYVAVTPATGSHKWGADGYCETCGLPNFGAKDPVFPTIPDGFTAEDLAAIQKAITDSQKGITDAQQAAHNALGQKIDGLHSVHTFSTDNVKTLTMSGSCTTYGVKFTLSTCDVCKATFLTAIEKDGKLGHTPDGEGKIVVEPTCQQFGSWQQTCTVCGEIINERTLNTVPHDHSVKSAQSVEPGCVTDGLYVYECKWCHEIQPQYNEVKKANPGHHTMPETAKPEDCTVEGGKITYECTVCGEETTENFEKKSAHEWVYSDVEMTLCGESATVTRSCKNCKVVQENVTVTKDMTDVVTALGDKWSTAHPERTTEADKVVYVPYKDKAGNLLDNWTKFKADNGLTDAADPANLNEGSEGYNANNNVVKYTYYECATCGQPIKVSSEAETHNFRVDTTKADWAGHKLDTDGNPIAECEAYTAHWKCIDSSCKDLDITYDQLVKELGHDWSADDWDDTSAGVGRPSAGWIYLHLPSCSDEGEAYRYCKRCNVDEDGNYDKTKTCGYETHSVSKVPHRIDRTAETYDYKAPTCTEDGYEKGPCQVCGQEDAVENVLPKTEHTWKYDVEDTSTWEVVWGNDDRFPCRSTLAINYCTKCNPDGKNTDCDGYKEFKTAAKAEHQAQRVKKVNTAPTCTTAGNVTYICDLCMETWSEDVDPLGHTWASDIWGAPLVNRVDPTCTQDGYEAYYCETCGYECTPEYAAQHGEWLYEVLPATGHTVAGQRVGIMNAFGVIVWNYGDTYDQFLELSKNYVDCRDYLYTRDFCKDCDWVSDVIYQIPLLDHEFEWRTDWDELTPEQQLQAAENGDLYELYIITPATCEDYGAYGYKCKQCGEVVFQDYYGPRGHWYYTKSSEELAGMPADEREQYLNVVGGNESSCLAPGSVTVECVHCGVRYAYGTSTEANGHTWELIKATDNANILCGDYLSSKTLAYCTKCGLVIELTGTTLPADNYATYLGKEDLTETQLEALKDLLDENDNLNVNKKDVVKPVETDTPEATDEPTETPTTEYYDTYGLIGLIVEAFKSTTMQTHKFVDEEKYRVPLLTGDCQTPTAYIVVCSICGLEEGKPVIKADTKDYTDYLWTLRPASGQTAFWDGFGYSNFNKNTDDNKSHTYMLPGEDEAKLHTGHELYQGLVAKYLTDNSLTEAAAAFEKVKTNVRYSGFNFTGFKFLENGHDFIVTNRAACVMDPFLTLLYEDWISGSHAWIDTLVFGAQTLTSTSGSRGVPGVVKSHYVDDEGNWYTLENILMDEGLAWNTTEVAKLAWWNENKGKTFEDYEAVIDALAEGPTEEVWNALCAALGGVSNYGTNYKGISNWCKKGCTINGGEDAVSTYFGFVLTTGHDIVYQVKDKAGNWDEANVYTFDENGEAVTNLPTEAEADEMIAKGEIDLRLVQYLYENQADLQDNAVYTKLAEKFTISCVLTNDGRTTCMTRLICKYHAQCGHEGKLGDHAQPDESNPDDLANCQHADRCVACGDYYDGSVVAHELVPYSELTEAEKKYITDTKVGTKTLYELFGIVENGEATCYNPTGASINICKACLDAAIAGNWKKPALQTGKGTDLEKAGWVSALTNLATTEKRGVNWEAVPGTVVEHTFKLDETSKEALGELYEDYLADVPAAAAKVEASVDNLKKAVFAFLATTGFTYDEEADAATRTTGTRFGTANYVLETVKIDEDGCLVYSKKTEKPAEKDLGYCVGEAEESIYHLCYVCLLAKGDVYEFGATGSSNNVKFGVETDPAEAVGTVQKKSSGNDFENKPITTSALYHVYAPAANQEGVKEGSVNLYCLRCQTNANNTYDQLSKKVANKGVVFYTDKSAFESDQSNPLVPDHSALVWDETKISGDVKISVGGKDVLSGLDNATGVVAATLANNDEIAESAALEVKEGVDLTLTIPEGATVKATEGIEIAAGGSLTINGGEQGATVEGSLTIVADAAKTTPVTLKNITLNGQLETGGGADVEIDGCVINDTSNFAGLSIQPKGQKEAKQTITVTNSTITSGADDDGTALFVNGDTNNLTLTLTNCNIIGSDVGLAIMDGKDVQVSGCHIYGGRIAALVRGGNVTCTGCEFIVGQESEQESWTQSFPTWTENAGIGAKLEAALVIANNGGGYGKANVTTSGCTFAQSNVSEAKGISSYATETAEGLTQIGDSGYYYEAAEEGEKANVMIGVTNKVDAGIELAGDLAQVTFTAGTNAFYYENESTTAKESPSVEEFEAKVSGVTVAVNA